MSLDGKFGNRYIQRMGGQLGVSFVITNSNLFQKETFNCVLMNPLNPSRMLRFDKLQLSKGKSLRFDFDTVGWEWHQADCFIITDKRGRELKKWTCQTGPAPLNIPSPSSSPNQQNDARRRQLDMKISMIQQRIDELQSKIQMIEMDRRIWQLKDMDVTCRLAYQAKLEEKHSYSVQVIRLQSELSSLQSQLLQSL